MTLAELGMVTIPSTFPIANVETAFALDGTPSDPRTAEFAEAFSREFLWYARALRAGRLTAAVT
jgi:hypothetical protein